MPAPEIKAVGEADFPVIYAGLPFETKVTASGLTQTKQVRTVVRVQDDGTMSYGVEFLRDGKPGHFFGASARPDPVAQYRCLILLDGHEAIDEKTIHVAATTVADGQSEIGTWQAGRVKMMIGVTPPDLVAMLLLLYDTQVKFNRDGAEELIRKGTLTVGDELRLLGFEDPADMRARKIREREALVPLRKIIDTFRRHHALRVQHGTCKCPDIYGDLLLDGVRRGITDQTILAAVTYFQFMRYGIAMGSALVAPLVLGRTPGLAEQYKFRLEALLDAVTFGEKIAIGDSQAAPANLRQSILDWDRRWKTAPLVKSI